jgi:hypothetical protein
MTSPYFGAWKTTARESFLWKTTARESFLWKTTARESFLWKIYLIKSCRFNLGSSIIKNNQRIGGLNSNIRRKNMTAYGKFLITVKIKVHLPNSICTCQQI